MVLWDSFVFVWNWKAYKTTTQTARLKFKQKQYHTMHRFTICITCDLRFVTIVEKTKKEPSLLCCRKLTLLEYSCSTNSKDKDETSIHNVSHCHVVHQNNNAHVRSQFNGVGNHLNCLFKLSKHIFYHHT